MSRDWSRMGVNTLGKLFFSQLTDPHKRLGTNKQFQSKWKLGPKRSPDVDVH